MGAALVGIVKALNCESCSKYFLNELTCDSECCEGHLCSAHLETHETGKDGEESEDEFVSDWCTLRHRG